MRWGASAGQERAIYSYQSQFRYFGFLVSPFLKNKTGTAFMECKLICSHDGKGHVVAVLCRSLLSQLCLTDLYSIFLSPCLFTSSHTLHTLFLSHSSSLSSSSSSVPGCSAFLLGKPGKEMRNSGGNG